MRLIVLVFVAVVCWTSGAQATTYTPTIQKAEIYLQELKTAYADFVQTAHDGGKASGRFYLSRPGKLRFDYDNSDDFIVADGTLIYFYDSQLDEQTNAPIGQTLADFLLRKSLKLSGDVSVKNVNQGGGYLRLTLVQTADPAAGELTLFFDERADQPFSLKKWEVKDSQGLKTTVELFNLTSVDKMPPGLFHYVDPEFGKDKRFNN